MAQPFPPNPEDGELWLPSDVFHEIASSNLAPPHRDSIDLLHGEQIPAAALPPPSFVALQPRAAVTHQFQVSDGMFRSKRNVNGSVSVGVPNAPFAYWNRGISGTFRFHNPIPPTQNQGFENRAMVLPEKRNCYRRGPFSREFMGISGGTGVFLPRIAGGKENADDMEGTGVSHHYRHRHNSVVLPSRRKNKNGNLAKQEASRVSSDVCLPSDWSY